MSDNKNESGHKENGRKSCIEISITLIGLIASCLGIFAFTSGKSSLDQLFSMPTLTATPTQLPTQTPTYWLSSRTKTPNPTLSDVVLSETLNVNICNNTSTTIENKVIITPINMNYNEYVDLGVSSDGRSMDSYHQVGTGENIVYFLNVSEFYEIRIMSFYRPWLSSDSCAELRLNKYTKPILFTATFALPTIEVTPSLTSRPTGTSKPECTKPKKLIVGKQAVVVTFQVRVRKSPGLEADLVNLLQRNRRVDVIDGPVCADHIWWWKVFYDGQNIPDFEGWVGEGDSTTYWLERVPSPLD